MVYLTDKMNFVLADYIKSVCLIILYNHEDISTNKIL